MENTDYRISLFKPTTPYSRSNRNIIISMVIVWALAVFGFQILLKIVEKPTAEKALITYNDVSYRVFSGIADEAQNKEFIHSLLSVLGKTTSKDQRIILDNALTWSVFNNIVPQEQKSVLLSELSGIISQRDGISALEDKDYLLARDQLAKMESVFLSKMSLYLDIQPNGIMADLLPMELKPDLLNPLDATKQAQLSDVMNLYLVHNQSFLTDARFIGFPFHYWYTAEFLLILFVFLCWLYCVRIERINKKLNIQES